MNLSAMTPIDPIEEAIFHAASQLDDPDRRTAFLRRACGDDPNLLARITSLLEADARAGEFFEGDPLQLKAIGAVHESISPASPPEMRREL